MKTKTVKRAQTKRVRDGHHQEALNAATLALVKDLAGAWIREGTKGDEPGGARSAYELLLKHGYTWDGDGKVSGVIELVPPPPSEPTLVKLRAAGWMVAVHNDYRQHGRLLTFWLFVRNGIAVKGEGYTDAEALAQVLKQTPEGR